VLVRKRLDEAMNITWSLTTKITEEYFQYHRIRGDLGKLVMDKLDMLLSMLSRKDGVARQKQIAASTTPRHRSSSPCASLLQVAQLAWNKLFSLALPGSTGYLSSVNPNPLAVPELGRLGGRDAPCDFYRASVATVALMVSFASHAYTECQVTLLDAFAGDISGGGQYALWLDYTYTLSTGGSVSSSGYILLSNSAAATIAAAALSARVSGQTNITIRYLNSGGASVDAVCGSPGRGDLIGIRLSG
jgi:hypothetical protein